MKTALAIKSHGPGHSFSLTSRISLGFTGMERSRPSVRLTVESSVLPFGGLSFFIGQHSAHFVWCMALPIDTDVKAVRVCPCSNLRLSKPSYYHIYLHLPECQMWLGYCPSFIALPVCLITFWYWSNLTENAFRKRFASYRQWRSCIFYFTHVFPALFASRVFWIWIDRLNEMMISVTSVCVWRLITNDSVSPPPSKDSLFQTISVHSLFAAFLHSPVYSSCKRYRLAVLQSVKIVADLFMRVLIFLFHLQSTNLVQRLANGIMVL